MAVFKCKICGGSLNVKPGDSIAECEYCGTIQTLPKLDNDRKINLYERANQYRRDNEYDKAMGLYEQILQDDISDAETYWSLVLCKYGIEYVEDPSSHKWIPTVHRVQYTPVVADTDYKSAIQYADETQKQLYEDEAKKIDIIQKGILEVAAKEDPFDIFICYKEADDKGQRTPDSVLANDLYYLLTDEGYKVFFSRITLEDKLGTAYEPYIFNALNSSKIMLVLGTKPEYFNAVWVKNEWSRFMKLMENDRTKMLVPCYRDMDPYDLPEEFAHLQAQDMSKLGFSQDIIRGIKKILDPTIPNETIIIQESSTDDQKTIDLSVKKLFLSLEEEDWQSAEEYCEKILDLDPENAQAYLGKLMIDLKVPDPVSLKNSQTDFEENLNYKRALRYSDDELKTKLEEYNAEVKNNLQYADYEEYYQKTRTAMKELPSSESNWASLASAFARLGDYKDSDELRKKCLESEEKLRVDRLYSEAMRLQQDACTIKSLDKAIDYYMQIADKKDVNEQIKACQNKIEEIHKQDELSKRKDYAIGFLKRTSCILVGMIFVLITIIFNNFQPYSSLLALIAGLLLIAGAIIQLVLKPPFLEKIIGFAVCLVAFIISCQMFSSEDHELSINGAGILVFAFIALVLATVNLFKRSKSNDNSNFNYSTSDSAFVKTPISSSNVGNYDYVKIQSLFYSSGFTNITCVGKKDVVLGLFTRENSIVEVSIGGKTSFMKNKKFQPDTPVVITYHARK